MKRVSSTLSEEGPERARAHSALSDQEAVKS